MNNNPNQTQPLSSVLKSIPILYKLLGASLIVTGIFSLFTNLFPIIFANYPYYTLFYVNLWRLFTSLLISEGVLASIFSLLVLWFVLPLLERNISTVIVAVDILVNNFAIQLLYTLVWLIVYFINDEFAGEMRSMGIWGVWMIILTRICQSDSEGDIKFCCMPFTIKKKLYPLAMLIIVGVLSFSFPLDMTIGYLVGLVQCRFLNGTLIRFGFQQYQALEDSFVFRCLKNRQDFKKLADAPYSQLFSKESQSPYTEFYAHFVSKSEQNEPQTYNVTDTVGSTNFQTMKGGVAIGGAPTEVQPNSNHWGNTQSPTNQKKPTGYLAFEDQN